MGKPTGGKAIGSGKAFIVPTPWHKKQMQSMQKEIQALQAEKAQLSKGSSGEDKPDPAATGTSNEEPSVKECRDLVTKWKAKVTEVEDTKDQGEFDLYKPMLVKAEADLQAVLDKQQAAKPADQRQRELEREVKRLETAMAKQKDTSEKLQKHREEA